jgi:hypothetical protein
MAESFDEKDRPLAFVLEFEQVQLGWSETWKRSDSNALS